MHTLLQKLLEKRNVDVKKMSGEEKKDFDRWNAILSGDDISVKKIEDFCRVQVNAIEKRFDELDSHKNELLLMQHLVYRKIIQMIKAEQQERMGLERYLNELIDTQ